MRCVGCNAFSLSFICSSCKQALSEFNLAYQEIDGLKIYSFYDYSDVKNFIHTKHSIHGAFVLKRLARLSFSKFAREFKYEFMLNAVGIDDRNLSGYSHTAILANALKSEVIVPIFGAIHATCDIKYSGESLKFRQRNPRNFKIIKTPKEPVILVDDLITTGTTLIQARDAFKRVGVKTAFALVLADAKY